jgi:sulfotransferase family protein
MYPDFIGIGAQKAGTTWLHRNLQAHPQIHMPRKEVHYFDRKIRDRSGVVSRLIGRSRDAEQWRRQVRQIPKQLAKSPSFQELRWNFRYYMRPYDDRWYAQIFEPKKGKVSGEITPAYSVLEKDRIAHVHRLMPETKLIFFMRNPIERVWSHTVMSFDKVEKGSATAVSDKELLRKIERDSSWKLSNYIRTLENWGSFYREERIFVGFLEDVHFFPEELLRRLYYFLEVEPHFDERLVGKKIHTRSDATMPTSVAVQLAKNFHEEISRLGERFGGYAAFWLHCAEQLIENPPEEKTITYPLFESYLWEMWPGARQIRSGPLHAVRVAG